MLFVNKNKNYELSLAIPVLTEILSLNNRANLRAWKAESTSQSSVSHSIIKG